MNFSALCGILEEDSQGTSSVPCSECVAEDFASPEEKQKKYQKSKRALLERHRLQAHSRTGKARRWIAHHRRTGKHAVGERRADPEDRFVCPFEACDQTYESSQTTKVRRHLEAAHAEDLPDVGDALKASTCQKVKKEEAEAIINRGFRQVGDAAKPVQPYVASSVTQAMGLNRGTGIRPSPSDPACSSALLMSGQLDFDDDLLPAAIFGDDGVINLESSDDEAEVADPHLPTGS